MTTESTNTGSQSAADGAAGQSSASDSAANRGNLRPSDAPVLGPRPVYRPDIDKHTARAFRRPDGQSGSFAPHTTAPQQQAAAPELVNRPPDSVLAEAFGRPEGSDELLQRDPDDTGDSATPAPPGDPWRDPDASARLGAPAVGTPQPPRLRPGIKLSAREVLFGSRVAPKALVILGVIALVIGLAGGLVGRLTAEATSVLTSKKVTLAQDGVSGKPQGSVSKVVDSVMPSVVQIRETVGDNGALGSGVVIDGGGYIVTNNHVISMVAMDRTNHGKIQVTFSDGSRLPASLVGRDPKTDLAVLKVDNVKNLTVARLGKSDDVQVGDATLAIGSPLGLQKTVTAGIVSALHRAMVETPEAGDDTAGAFDAVQTDAAINHGNSGGALVDGQGRLIGINTAIRSESGGSVGLGFAIPVDLVRRVAQTIIHHGVIEHPWLGVSAKTKQVENDTLSGAAIADVVANSPAAKAGLTEGDVVVKVGDREVTEQAELTVAVMSQQIGQKVDFQIVRDGRQVTIPVTLESDRNAPKPPQ
ncbi:trypsin-like peptidase domain-containing protein [Nocardia jiangxiensis]|uniref:Trypsin-like peptidase domain-containing protein n=1 Tax=Nocardia jiangxiensis TaxID=282685 RepID=A0ABW6RQM5_9NOCA